MTTLLIRDSGPDKRFEMTESNVSRARDPGGNSPERKQGKRLTWIPAVAALLTFLIGLSDVLAVFKPAWHQALEAHKVNAVVPGTLTNVTRTSDVIIGLLLLMLARGLRRRKRRAWQAVIALLAFDIVIHFLHFPRAISGLRRSWRSCCSPFCSTGTRTSTRSATRATGGPRCGSSSSSS